jgi:prephenate dehydrogenase
MRVHVVGTGLIGTSIGLAVRAAGGTVTLDDRDDGALAAAVALGAGDPVERDGPGPDLVVVAVPPNHIVDAALAALHRWPGATVTDVASVKEPVLDGIEARAPSLLERFVGGHPMAGREVAGPAGALPDLFRDRVWVLTPAPATDPERVETVLELIAAVGAVPLELSPQEHDEAVALTSHTPQVLASLLAGRLLAVDPDHVLVSGQGLRDTVRIAGSDPDLWADILTANAGPVVGELRAIAEGLTGLADRLDDGGPAARGAVYDVVAAGRRGLSRLPGKHGAAGARYRSLRVAVPDEPGALATLLSAAADAKVNLEDVRIEHALGRPTGIVELSVAPGQAPVLAGALASGGWSLRA